MPLARDNHTAREKARGFLGSQSADLEFHVGRSVFANLPDAAERAIVLSATTGEPQYIDVVTWTRKAALRWGGEPAGEVYDDDPEASVHERLEVRATPQGRVP